MSAHRTAWWPAVGPAAIGVLLLVRASVADGLDLAVAAPVAATMAAIAWLAATRTDTWIAALLLVGPVALVATPARTEFSFNLARPDDTGWFVFTLAVAVAVGLSVAGSVAVLAGSRPRLRHVGVLVACAVLGSTAFAAGVRAIDPQPDLGAGLGDAERRALPDVALVNHGYGIDADAVRTVDDDGTPRLRARLVNDSDLPHSFTVDGVVDVYVPAGRDAVLDVVLDAELAGGVVRVYCAVGDHEDLGMVVELRP